MNFFLNFLSISQRSTAEYTKEVKVSAEGKKFPPYWLEFYCLKDLTVYYAQMLLMLSLL